LRRRLAEEYPAGEAKMNRELIRLLAYLDEPSIVPRLVEFLNGEAETPEKIQTAVFARYITKGWTTQQKLVVLAFYEGARKLEGGYSLKGYFDAVAKDFCANLTPDERRLLLTHGDRQPSNALAVLSSLAAVDAELITVLVDLDRRLAKTPSEEEAAKTLQTGIIAILGESKDPAGMTHLRVAFETQPERRGELAMGLAQQPDGDNWPLLLRALPVVDGVSAQEILVQLARVNRKPETPEAVRQTILCGLRLGDAGGDLAVKLLAKWTGQNPPPGANTAAALAAYQNWFAANYPNLPPATPPKAESARYSIEELNAYLAENGGKGVASRGAVVFEKAACLKCHRFGGQGESIGPDLTTVASRFQRREILESILHPSQVISDQYAGKTVTTVDGKIVVGLVAPQPDGSLVVLQPNAQKVTISKADVEQIAPSKQSTMPDGLLNTLVLQDVADLFAFLGGGRQEPTDFVTDEPLQEINTASQSRRGATQQR
jgi:putative heme-binding domain-containing protein